jgi:inorganic pyrophosphatase
MTCNPWHAISSGFHAPGIVNAIIEISRGTRTKYEVDKESGQLRLDRILTSSISYPFHYGFIPQSYGQDNDPLDILLFCSESLVPLTLVEVRVLGVMHMIDQGEPDHKIIGVAAGDQSTRHIQELTELPSGTMDDIQTFFSNYKRAENKKVVVQNFSGRQEAYDLINESLDFYKKMFPKQNG